MESLAFLAVLIPLLGIAVAVVFVVAIIQEGKSERRGGFKQAFYTVVALVMLGITVGATIGLLNTTFRNVVFPSAKDYARRYNAPPQLYLTGLVPTDGAVKPFSSPTTIPLACTTDCEFTDADKASVASWRSSYELWQAETSDNLIFRKDLAALLPFLLVAFPLFIVFFRMMQRGSAMETAETKKVSPLRSLYFYFIAFSGLLVAVIGAGGLINLGLNQLLRVETSNQATEAARPIYDDGGVKSIIACADKCNFSETDVTLAQQWLTDSKNYFQKQISNNGKTAHDLSTFIPLLLIGFPLFWFHFSRIRKEGQESQLPTPATQ